MATTINVILADSTTAITVSTGARGPAGAGNNSITSATTSDGTAALYLDSIRFETSNGGPTQLGEMAWESTDGSIDAMLESGVIVAMGEDLVIRVRNATASPIAKGTALAYDGTTGASGKIEVKPWVGSNIPTAKLFLGFAASDMTANGDGYSQWFGKLTGINTSGGAQNWQDEQIIYAVPGASATITNVTPTSGEYAAAAVVMNAGSGTSGILYVRPTFEKFPVSADITDATSDGQSNPGKVLKTDINGALQIEQITLGNATPNVAGSVGIVGSVNTSHIANPDDSAIDLKFGTTSGAILSTGDASATFSSGKAILWGTTADATLTNLGGGTAGKAIFGAATVATANETLVPLVSLGTPVLDSGWTESPAGTYNANIPSGQESVTFTLPGFESGAIYLITITVTRSAGSCLARFIGPSTTSTAVIGLSGVYNLLVASASTTSNTFWIRSESGGFTGSVSNIKIRKLA